VGQSVGISSFHLWIANDGVVASLCGCVAYKMCHLVTKKAFE